MDADCIAARSPQHVSSKVPEVTVYFWIVKSSLRSLEKPPPTALMPHSV